MKKYSPEFRTTGPLRNLYWIWKAMNRRCQPGLLEGYTRYSGRGIAVCEDWKQSWPVFAKWAIAAGWRPDLEIDRRDNNDGYSPENCRFVTHLDNCRNRDSVNISAVNRVSNLRRWARPFICVETGESFINQQQVVLSKGISAASISQTLSGKAKTAGGLHWQYIATGAAP